MEYEEPVQDEESDVIGGTAVDSPSFPIQQGHPDEHGFWEGKPRPSMCVIFCLTYMDFIKVVSCILSLVDSSDEDDEGDILAELIQRKRLRLEKEQYLQVCMYIASSTGCMCTQTKRFV